MSFRIDIQTAGETANGHMEQGQYLSVQMGAKGKNFYFVTYDAMYEWLGCKQQRWYVVIWTHKNIITQ